MSAAAVSNSISVVCISTSEKIVNQCTLNVPVSATVADLKLAMGNAKKAVHVLVGGAAPSEATLIRDLAASYASSEDGLLHVNYSVEGSFGATDGCAICTILGGGAQWS